MCSVRGLNLTGRIVGYSEGYIRDHSQLGPEETPADLYSKRTVWAYIAHDTPGSVSLMGVNKHTGEPVSVLRDCIHTVMPLASDNENDEVIPDVGDIVVIDDEADCIVPAGVYRVSAVNDNGSFHVGGNTAIWPRRILELYEFFETGPN